MWADERRWPTRQGGLQYPWGAHRASRLADLYQSGLLELAEMQCGARDIDARHGTLTAQRATLWPNAGSLPPTTGCAGESTTSPGGPLPALTRSAWPSPSSRCGEGEAGAEDSEPAAEPDRQYECGTRVAARPTHPRQRAGNRAGQPDGQAHETGRFHPQQYRSAVG